MRLPRGLVVQVDAYTRGCLTAIAILLTVLLVALWGATPPLVPAAQGAGEVKVPPSADGFNPGAQRQAIVEAIGVTNQKLDRLLQLLESGKVRVTVEAPAAAPPGKDAGHALQSSN